jgi:predicted permease
MTRRTSSVVTVLTLALAIGLTTAIFSVVESVLLRPLPFYDPDRLVAIAQSRASSGRDGLGAWTATEFVSRAQAAQSVSLYGDAQATFIDGGQSEVLRGMRVSTNFFDTLGTHMWLGRGFEQGEDRWPRTNVVILTYDLWRWRFGLDSSIIGRTLQLNDQPHRVVGVLPPDFEPLRMSNPAETPGYFMPRIDNAAQCPGCIDGLAIARLQPSITSEHAAQELTRVLQQLRREYPDAYPADAIVSVTPLQQLVTRDAGPMLWAVMVGVAFVLVIACGNVAGLLLTRHARRERDLAVRAALGASRGRLVRELLVEVARLVVAGGAAGIALAWIATPAIVRFAPPELPRLTVVHVDHVVLLFAIVVTTAAALLVGLAPAWSASRVDLDAALRHASARATPSRRRMQTALVVGECAVAFALAVGGGLLAQSVAHLYNVDAGFDARNVLTLTPSAGDRGGDAARLRYFQALMDAVATVPGVASVGMTSNVPLSHVEPMPVRVEGAAPVSDSAAPLADMFIVAGDYFAVLRVPLARGRYLTRRDGVEDPPAAVVSESFVTRLLPPGDPIGRRIRLGPADGRAPWLTIVGVVGDVRNAGFDRPPDAAVYQPQAVLAQHYTRVVARTAGDPRALKNAVGAAIRNVDPLKPFFHVQPLTDYVDGSLAAQRFALLLVGAFGVLALALAAIGLYGVASQTVVERSAELGIRSALGASPRRLLGMVLAQGVLMATSGAAAGTVIALALGRMLTALMFGVTTRDPATFAAAAAVLISTSLAGTYLPARRAARSDFSLLTSAF